MFKIQLHDFEYTSKRNRWGGRILRFSITWTYTTGTEQHGMSVPGCIAQYDRKGNFVWTPPSNNYGTYGKKHMLSETPDTYNAVRRKLEESGFAKAMKEDVQELIKETDPFQDNPELPQIVEETL